MMSYPPKTITSAANPLIKKIKSLGLKKYRDEENLFIVEGARHVGEAIEAGWRPAYIAFSKPETDTALLAAAEKSGAEVFETTADLLSRMTGRDNAQNLLGVFQPRTEKLATIAMAEDQLFVALEEIRDPGNLGTVIRTAEAAGANGAILIGNTCDPWSPEAIRASMGAFSRMKIILSSAEEFSDWRKTWKGKVIGTHLSARTVDYREAEYARPLIILMGSEQNGLSPRLTETADNLVKIPMGGKTESLNLAVSTGIMLYEAFRQQKQTF